MEELYLRAPIAGNRMVRSRVEGLDLRPTISLKVRIDLNDDPEVALLSGIGSVPLHS